MDTLTKTRIMVVEDEAITAMDIQNCLEELGYSVPATASSGEEAISLAEKLKPDLIFMDIVLKGKMDGTEAAQYISEHYNIPIVFLTAYSDDDTFNRAILSSPYGYLTKPFEARGLHIAVELALFKYATAIKISSADQRYHLVMENATCGILVTDESAYILDLNKQAELILGYERDKIVNMEFKKFVQSSDRDYSDIQFQKVLTENTIGPNELHIQRADGSIGIVEFSAVHVESSENKFILSILNDVTERNRLRAQALLSDKLATIGTLAAGIIHEINNPMTYVLTNLLYIKKKLQISTPEDVQRSNFRKKFNDIINESIQGAEKIKEIVFELKGFARADQGEFTVVNINEVVDSAIHMAYPQFKNYAIVNKDFSSELPSILLNSGKLHQVFLNLIINAAQSMDPDKQSKNVINIKTGIENNRVCIAIHDTGRGIAPDVLPKIFEPFFTTKPVGIGTGLGLSICNEIIHSLGGEIKAESEEGSGSTFSVYVPLNLIAEKSIFTKMEAKKITDKKILVVDDEETMLATLEQILGSDNQIIKALGGRAAYNVLAKDNEGYDIILCDFNMPDINAIDIFQYLMENNPNLCQRIIFMTAGTYSSSMADFLSHIKNLCIVKPFTREQLLETINDVLDQASANIIV